MNGRFSASKESPFVRLLPFTASVHLIYSLNKSQTKHTFNHRENIYPYIHIVYVLAGYHINNYLG